MWAWPDEAIRPLAAALQPRHELISEQDLEDSDLRLLSVRFDGTMDTRAARPMSIKGRLFRARPGDVVFSKIDVRNGAIGVIPEHVPTAAFTAEFPIYAVNAEVALPAYVHLLFRSDFFRATVNGMVSGASGRKRVLPEQLQTVRVPLPALDVQLAICRNWHQSMAGAGDLEAQAARLERGARERFAGALGLTSVATGPVRKAFALSWSSIGRWGLDQCRIALTGATETKWHTRRVAELCRLGSGGTPSRQVRAFFEKGDIPWVKTTEVRDGVIDDTQERITREALANSSAKVYPKGSLIVAMYGQGATRGRTAKLGLDAATNQACCVLYDFSPLVEPDFLWRFLMVRYEDLRSLASGNNQPNLNAAMIANYDVALPPIHIQRQLAAAFADGVEQAEALRAKAAGLRESARQEIESALPGHPLREASPPSRA